MNILMRLALNYLERKHAIDKLLDTFLDGELIGWEDKLGEGRRLIGRGKPSEICDRASRRLMIQIFGVALDANLQGTGDINLPKGRRRQEGTDLVAVRLKGTDKSCDDNQTGIKEETGKLTDTADILGAIGIRKAKILIETRAEAIPI